jgi:hypothetical protein
VNLHPFLEYTDIPKDANGVTEYKYMSKDCFHLSQLGHARTANSYWNSMLTPERQRLRYSKKEFEEFRCPTQQSPFLMTTRNSWSLKKINSQVQSHDLIFQWCDNNVEQTQQSEKIRTWQVLMIIYKIFFVHDDLRDRVAWILKQKATRFVTHSLVVHAHT